MLYGGGLLAMGSGGGSGGIDWTDAGENLLTSGSLKSSGSSGQVLIGDALAGRGSWSATPFTGAALNIRHDTGVARLLLDAQVPMIQFHDQDGSSGKKCGLLAFNGGYLRFQQYADEFAGVSRTPLTVDLTNGSVGINQTTPVYGLDVKANVRILPAAAEPLSGDWDNTIALNSGMITDHVFMDYGFPMEQRLSILGSYDIAIVSPSLAVVVLCSFIFVL